MAEDAEKDAKTIAELRKLVTVVKRLTQDVAKISNLVGPLGELTENINKAEDSVDDLQEPFEKAVFPRKLEVSEKSMEQEPESTGGEFDKVASPEDSNKIITLVPEEPMDTN